MAKAFVQSYTNDEIREMSLKFFYNKAGSATSLRGKKGSSLKMSDVKSGLKSLHGFKDNQIIGNLNYLLSQGWVKEEIEKKSFTTDKGVLITPKRFEGINIEAVGSVVTIGDGNQINVKFKEAAQSLSELRKSLTQSKELSDEQKLDVVTDIDSIQDQLAKPKPNKNVVQALWTGIDRAAAVAHLAHLAHQVAPYITALLT